MKAMILAAGFGTRLWPLTVGRTKPALPFLNRPLIAYTIEYLKRHGVEDLIINLHHEPDSVRAQMGDGSDYGVRIDYSVEEPEILGTSGALDRVREQLDKETFVVINGKIITEIDLGAAMTCAGRPAIIALAAASAPAASYPVHHRRPEIAICAHALPGSPEQARDRRTPQSSQQVGASDRGAAGSQWRCLGCP